MALAPYWWRCNKQRHADSMFSAGSGTRTPAAGFTSLSSSSAFTDSPTESQFRYISASPRENGASFIFTLNFRSSVDRRSPAASVHSHIRSTRDEIPGETNNGGGDDGGKWRVCLEAWPAGFRQTVNAPVSSVPLSPIGRERHRRKTALRHSATACDGKLRANEPRRELPLSYFHRRSRSFRSALEAFAAVIATAAATTATASVLKDMAD